MLSVVGFFLWVIRNFVRGLRRKSQLPPIPPIETPETSHDKNRVDWPTHIFLSKTDDIPIPGRIVSVDLAGAFMESSACLDNGQQITIYIDIPDRKQLRLTALVAWARESRDGRNAAQLSFPGLNEEKRRELLNLTPQ
jgi:hypothetical protein